MHLLEQWFPAFFTNVHRIKGALLPFDCKNSYVCVVRNTTLKEEVIIYWTILNSPPTLPCSPPHSSKLSLGVQLQHSEFHVAPPPGYHGSVQELNYHRGFGSRCGTTVPSGTTPCRVSNITCGVLEKSRSLTAMQVRSTSLCSRV